MNELKSKVIKIIEEGKLSGKDLLKEEAAALWDDFLCDHKEYLLEYEKHDFSSHTPKYTAVDTTALEEFYVTSMICDLSEKELQFLCLLVSDMLIDEGEDIPCMK